ncbi:MAG: hypothetical protein IPK32_07170 [Verrucomicrobiaceae bacterium]|nr:hypothetical protein [Verrucomicrobiaceae bacterium]
MTTLQYKNETYITAGKGPCAGAQCYFNARTSEVLTVYQAICINTGPAFSLLCVPGNPALQSVFISRAVLSGLRLEDKLLVLPDLTDPARPRAVAAWLATPSHLPKTTFPKPVLANKPRPMPKPQRLKGVICFVAKTGTFGRILSDQQESLFVAGSELAPGMALRLGTRVSFTRVLNPQGPAASQVSLSA